MSVYAADATTTYVSFFLLDRIGLMINACITLYI